MSHYVRLFAIALLHFAIVLCVAPIVHAAEEPLHRVVDLNIGETATLKLSDGKSITLRLLGLEEDTDPIRHAVREARVSLEIDGHKATLIAGPYRLPVKQHGVQIDCSATKGLNKNGTPAFWGLEKDVRLRVWPESSPWIKPGTFQYPTRQRWFATHTQMSNEPTYVDGGEQPSLLKIYYHSGLDIGGSEMQVQVHAATDALVVSVGTNVLEGHKVDTPIASRADVIYLLDARGRYYRYSHLKEFDPQILPSRQVKIGQRLGLLGKEGASGGWSHLHFEIKSRQPSGQWGTEEGYAFLWQANQEEHQPQLIAVARPHKLVRVGDEVTLDGSRSWAASKVARHSWKFGDGTTATGEQVKRTYDKPGVYSEVLEVRDAEGHTDYDFGVVHVLDPEKPELLPPTIHPAFFPTSGIQPGDTVTFKVRTFRTTDGEETWDFGDGTATETSQSDGNVRALAPNGYAATTHQFAKPGHYVVRVQRTNAQGLTATGHLHVKVDAPGEAPRYVAEVKTPPLKPADLDKFFAPPAEFAGDYGKYRSPLKFNDGREVKTAADWAQRRKEIIANWTELLGPWPPLVEKPKIVYHKRDRTEHYTRQAVDIEIAPNGRMTSGFLLTPHGEGPFPAVVVVFYDGETSAGMGKEMHGFAHQLSNRGYVTLSIGTPSTRMYPSEKDAELQPLSMLAYTAANCHTVLANLPQVDAKRIGVTGHSYGGKWSMFASCLYEKFACAAWSDGGIVFDEKRGNVNYWEPWYLGWQADAKRKEGIPSDKNPRTGAYKTMIERGMDLHELHALMAPRPLLVSGGSEDFPARWQALNHAVAVNKLLGYENRVAMTNRPNHTPTYESNEQMYTFFDRFLKK